MTTLPFSLAAGVAPGGEEGGVVTRAGPAVSFALSVVGGRKREILTGAFPWVAVRLDRPDGRKDRVSLDLWTGLDSTAEQHRVRIYAVGSGGCPAGPGAG